MNTYIFIFNSTEDNWAFSEYAHGLTAKEAFLNYLRDEYEPDDYPTFEDFLEDYYIGYLEDLKEILEIPGIHTPENKELE